MLKISDQLKVAGPWLRGQDLEIVKYIFIVVQPYIGNIIFILQVVPIKLI